MSDQYGYQPRPGQEVLINEDGHTRIRLELSTTTRGWDYSGTVEILAPGIYLTEGEREELVAKAADLQRKLREAGAKERDERNQADRLGPYAPPKPTK